MHHTCGSQLLLRIRREDNLIAASLPGTAPFAFGRELCSDLRGSDRARRIGLERVIRRLDLVL